MKRLELCCKYTSDVNPRCRDLSNLNFLLNTHLQNVKGRVKWIVNTLLCLIVGGVRISRGVDIFLNFSKVGGGHNKMTYWENHK